MAGLPVCADNSVDNAHALSYESNWAGVVKLVDAEDSKSSGPCVRVGSIPTSGTNNLLGSTEPTIPVTLILDST